MSWLGLGLGLYSLSGALVDVQACAAVCEAQQEDVCFVPCCLRRLGGPIRVFGNLGQAGEGGRGGWARAEVGQPGRRPAAGGRAPPDSRDATREEQQVPRDGSEG